MKLTHYLASIAAVVATVPAHATNFVFTLTGSATATFVLPSSPTPDFFLTGTGFYVDGVDGTVNGSPDLLDLYFANDMDGGGFAINSAFISTIGEQLYTNTEDTPTFRVGDFELTDFGGGAGRYALTIALAPNAVPEPATWAMMIGGLGLVGGAMRYRRRTTGVAFAG